MHLPRIFVPILLLISIALIVAGSLHASKNGFTVACTSAEKCTSENKKLTLGAIMILLGSVLSICSSIAVGIEYKATGGRVSQLFSMSSM